jgi:hypothetical protein
MFSNTARTAWPNLSSIRKKRMESALWALDLVAVVLLCRWALAEDGEAIGKKLKKGWGKKNA